MFCIDHRRSCAHCFEILVHIHAMCMNSLKGFEFINNATHLVLFYILFLAWKLFIEQAIFNMLFFEGLSILSLFFHLSVTLDMSRFYFRCLSLALGRSKKYLEQKHIFDIYVSVSSMVTICLFQLDIFLVVCFFDLGRGRKLTNPSFIFYLYMTFVRDCNIPLG